ncbi:gamma-glutamyltransferase [Arthrobacter sp. 35W]|uniref:gamma-glutamyltransferase n=1 Tax=Arthrobacter sp. 35W TaxID=1132441 RepID=UPI000478D4B6|nr:gamma-glutamyltransferase [Arthrobacter sp. 35W]
MSTGGEGIPARGHHGAAATGHPLATRSALRILAAGGSAVDAAIAAQAVIAVVMPHAAGLGGDLLALVRQGDGSVHAVNGTGCTPATAPGLYATDGGSSVTVPGIVDGWFVLHRRWGRLPLEEVFGDAIACADTGYVVDAGLAAAVRAQRHRITRYGGADWPLLATSDGGLWRQHELARLLATLAADGPGAFYAGPAAQALVDAVGRTGGTLALSDLASHRSEEPGPVETPWNGGRLLVQPPASQGILLAMAARWVEDASPLPAAGLDHLLVEATEAAFAHRSDAGGDPAALLDRGLDVDRVRAGGRGGPRAYLHTAGVAVADSGGMVVSSLVSVFDDFGSAVFVPELGIVLNNRAAGFTDGANAAGPGRRPVHTLAPAMLLDAGGHPLALATPGADGQVQTILQVLARMRCGGLSLHDAVAALRWRSEGGRLLIEEGHPATADLAGRGHDVVPRTAGDDVFGAVVAAGLDAAGPYAVGDWRRNVAEGAA